ncbi:MAG: FAD-dependent monooxygenase [Gammaproteobacteria bacterium]|nr:FAD-dependent monooxygenase [Gammaproteobacteria bacterium]
MSSPVLIVGGGIAGLCTAIALSDKSIPCTVFERNQFEDTTGTGIQLSPNATRLLFRAGLKKALLDMGRVSTKLVTRHWRTGRVTSYIPLGQIVDRYCDSPYLQILRSELVQILLIRARSCDCIELRPNESIETFEQLPTSASVLSNRGEYEGILVVGADGARSTIRKKMGLIPDPPFSTWHAWRTTINLDSNSEALSQTTLWCGHRAHVVTYPVDCQGTINCVFITKSNSLLRESWRQEGTVSDLQNCLSGWHTKVFELVDQIDESRLFRWGLYRHDKTSGRWSDGRCSLVGDAGHCVLPFLAQGAALAIEDSFTLAGCVHNLLDNIPKALRNYETARLSRTKSIQRRSARLGYVYHLGPPFSWLRDVGAKWAVHDIVRNIYAYENIDISN